MKNNKNIAASKPAASWVEDFNFDWRFLLANDAEAFQQDFDDQAWRQVRLPHDWSVEFSFDPVNGDGATGYLPGGIGWYRKRFVSNHSDNQRVFILFDGVYNNCELWCNGQPLGQNPYGYSPFWFDLTPYLNPAGEENAIAVKVDHSRYVDSRWYTGSGIYRDVKLITKSHLHIPIWGTRLTTPEVSNSSTQIALEIAVKNSFSETRIGFVRTEFIDPSGTKVAVSKTDFTLDAHQETICTQVATIPSPKLWQLENPHLYRAVTYLYCGNSLHEVYESPFGIRAFSFDPQEGFFLNGENLLIKGVCLHHDAGLVGTAVPTSVWRRRLTALKELGCNAIRLAHNPSSEAFLNLCDEMGFLVQVEFFDEWDNPKDKRLNKNEQHDDELSRGYAEHFAAWAESDLKRIMQRDRNHPCVFQWSIGNEIEWSFLRYEQATGYFESENGKDLKEDLPPFFDEGFFWTLPPFSSDEIKARFDQLPEEEHVLTKTAHQLAQWTREMDTTRPVVSNCVLPSVSHISGFVDALDVVGYSYRQVLYDVHHAAFPDKAIMGTENFGQWHEWKPVIERPFISGIFVWTGIHYLGESHKLWPQKGQPTGLLDFAGFERGSGLMFKTLWRDDPQVHLTTQQLEKSPYRLNEQEALVEKKPGGWRQQIWYWHDVNMHWNYEQDAQIVVEVYANCDEVELFLNGRSLGQQQLQDQKDRIFKWIVPFEPGTLEAHGRNKNIQQAATQLKTASEPASIQLSSDQSSLTVNGYDVAHLVAQLVDAQGIPIKHIDREIVFAVNGGCRILGVDNGSALSVQDYQSDRLITSQGRALLIIQAEKTAGVTAVTATSGNLQSTAIEINIKEENNE